MEHHGARLTCQLLAETQVLHLVAQVLETDLAQLLSLGVVMVAAGLQALDVVHRHVGPEPGRIEVARVGIDARISRAIGTVGECQQGGELHAAQGRSAEGAGRAPLDDRIRDALLPVDGEALHGLGDG
ncbi:hypothetical protein D3C87_1572000 [compost metagenome]